MSAYVSHRETPAQVPTNYYYRQQVQAPQRQPAILRDNYERWYTECTHLNRMVLSLRSGIHSDIAWALERLCRLAQNERFDLKDYPGLLDGLFDWPEWYVNQGYKELTDDHSLFSPPRDFAAHHRYALESLCVMRCAIMEHKNAIMVSEHTHTLPLILTALENLDFTKDQNQEPLLHLLEIFQVIAPNLCINASVEDRSNPVVPLNRIISKSNNRSLILAAFASLNSVLSNPLNAIHLGKATDALSIAIRYLPLLVDVPLIGASLEHLYIHVSNPASARAFLLNPQLPNVLKILSSMIITEQRWSVEDVSIDLTKPQRSLPLDPRAWSDYEMPKAEFEEILVKEEPKRCHEWMERMFVAKPDSEMTQVDIWTMYKDAFSPHVNQAPLLGASDVIKSITYIYPTAQAMVLSGPTQRFVVRGVERRRLSGDEDKFKCQWDKGTCAAPVLSSPSELAEHMLEHLSTSGASAANTYPCAWSTCEQVTPSAQHLRAHILTHIPRTQAVERDPSQSDTITIPGDQVGYPTLNPTSRPLPPPPKTWMVYERATMDPPSHCLTALLIIRLLFRTAFADVEAAPKADADHFGFPGVVEEETEEVEVLDLDSDREGARKGRRAFSNLLQALQNFKLRDEALMGWVIEMVDAVSSDI